MPMLVWLSCYLKSSSECTLKLRRQYNNKSTRVYTRNILVYCSKCQSSIILSQLDPAQQTRLYSSSSSSVGRVPRRATMLPTRPLAVVNRLIGLFPSVISVDFIPNACSIFTCQSTSIQNCYITATSDIL